MKLLGEFTYFTVKIIFCFIWLSCTQCKLCISFLRISEVFLYKKKVKNSPLHRVIDKFIQTKESKRFYFRIGNINTGKQLFLLFAITQCNFPVSTRRRFDVYTTSITLKRRHMDVKTTLCAYWVNSFAIFLHFRLAFWTMYIRHRNMR